MAVVGGGPAGLAASISSARQGARTLLLEKEPVLGGNATLALVHTVCGLYELDAERPRHVHPGLPREFARRLRDAGLASEPVRHGRVHVLPTYPEKLPGYLEEWTRSEPRLSVRCNTRLSGVNYGTDPVELRLNGGGSVLLAGRIVDASGRAITAPGNRQVNVPPADKMQIPSYIVLLDGVDPGRTEGYSTLRLTRALQRGVRSGRLPEGCESVLVRPGKDPGSAFLTVNIPDPWEQPGDPLDPDRLRSLTLRARERTREIVRFLRQNREGFEGCSVARWPRRLGVREAREMETRRTVTAEPLLEGKAYGDWVARSSWPIELWESHDGAEFTYPESTGYVPLSALVARFDGRVGVAGRCMGATHRAMGALRVIGTALATGEAVGVATALAARNDIELHRVDASEVRRRIRGGGRTVR